MKFFWLIVASLFIFSCDSSGPTSEDIAESEILIGLANEEFEDAFQVLSNPDLFDDCEDDIECLQLIDFTQVNTYYEQALSLNPDNVDAHFGLGITNFLMISQDQNLYDSINEWTNYFNGDDVTLNNDNILPTFDNFLNFNFSNFLNLIPIINNNVSRNNQNPPPELSDIQNLLETSFLNRLTESINHFDTVLENDFTFTLTGAIQGDNSLPNLELDNTEIYLLKSQMHLVSALINFIIAYNFDVPHYEMVSAECLEEEEDCWYSWYWEELYCDTYYYVDEIIVFENYDWLKQNSNFLSIRKANALPSVHSNLSNIHLSINSALEYLQNETDSQINDIIKMNDLSVDEVLEELENFNSMISNNNTMENGTVINYSNFLNSPVNNLKSIIPQYVINEVVDTCASWGQEELIYTRPSFEMVANSWQEFKNQVNDPTIGGLFPEFTVDDMMDYMGIDCNEFDFEDCD